MAIEALIYSIAALVTLNSCIILITIWVTLRNSQADEYKRRYWKAMLDKAQKELAKDEPNKQFN
jgi:nitrogen fixation-related uncharacterized protein